MLMFAKVTGHFVPKSFRTQVIKYLLADSNASFPSVNQIPAYKLESISISAYEVEDIFKTFKTGKATGPDSIDNRLLKELALSTPLTDLFNFFSFKRQSAKFLETSTCYSCFQKE